MNKIVIIGNLTRDPETGTTRDGTNWTRFSVAVRRRFKKGDDGADTDYMRVTAWRKLGETCAKFLKKGRKVCVWGTADVYAWLSNDSEPRGQLEITADDVEFLSSGRPDDRPREAPQEADGYVQVDGEEDPFDGE